jgi:ATP/maltotriose-dependent transcriptional regulator MalT
MKNAKQTADAYEQTRSLLKNKLEPLFDEKNEKREAIRKVFNKPEEQEERRVRERAKIAKMNKEFREENKNLIAKYKELLNDNKENEKVFSEIYAAAQKLNPELKEEDVRTLIM